MKITCISDLHGHFPKLAGGDLLIVAGDLTVRDTEQEYWMFHQWIEKQFYTKKIVIAGNHDNLIQKDKEIMEPFGKMFDYLCDSGTEFEGLKIWGSPWTKRFNGMNPNCMAFTCETEEELAEKWALIPDDIDILITHSPAYGLQDGPDSETRLGSTSLVRWIANHVNTLQIHVCGHIHEGYGVFDIRESVKKCGDPRIPVYVNASHVNERYEPVNKPIEVEI